MKCQICAYPLTKNEYGRRRKYCSLQCSSTAAIRRQYAKRLEVRAQLKLGKAAQPKRTRTWESKPDIPAAEIERRFQLAKQRLRYARLQDLDHVQDHR